MIIQKLNRDGIDIAIEAIQQKMYANLLGAWDADTVFTMYPRANKDYNQDNILPVVSLDDKDYSLSLFDDKVFVNSFFLVNDESVYDPKEKTSTQNISLIFQADLVKLYSDTERVDEVFNADVLRVLDLLKRRSTYVVGDITVVRGLDKVYSDLTFTSDFKEKIKYSDVSHRHVVKFTFDVIYGLDCNKTVSPVCAPVSVNVNGVSQSINQSGTTLDLTIVDGNDDPQGVETPIGSGNFVVPTGMGALPINTANSFKTGAVSYYTGDDGDIENGRGADHLTLDFNNEFGNTARFTDKLGTQIYTDGIALDWGQWDQVAGKVVGIVIVPEANDNLKDHLDRQPFTRDSYSNWEVQNVGQLFQMMNWGLFRSYINYAPFNLDTSLTVNRVWSSTFENVSNATYLSNVGLSVSNQSATNKAFITRDYTMSELGL